MAIIGVEILRRKIVSVFMKLYEVWFYIFEKIFHFFDIFVFKSYCNILLFKNLLHFMGVSNRMNIAISFLYTYILHRSFFKVSMTLF